MKPLTPWRGIGRRKTNSADGPLPVEDNDSDTGPQDSDSPDTAAAAPIDPGKSGIAGADSAQGLAANPRGARWRAALAYAVLPAIALLLAASAGYLRWYDSSAAASAAAGTDAVRSASDSTVSMLSYKAGSVQSDLTTAANRLTGGFKDSYTSLVHDVVIPGAQQRQISSVATVQAAAAESTTATHAVVLLFVSQSVTVGTDPPSDTASSVRVTLDRVDDRWLVSGFDPV